MSLSQRKNSQNASSLESRDEWVIVSLSPTGERETNLELIRKSIFKLLKTTSLEVFIPAISQTVRGESETMFYMQGYIFIKYIPGVSYFRLKETQYFNEILSSYHNRKIRYKLLKDSELNKIRTGVENLKLSEFKEGDEVYINKGDFKNLPGIIKFVYNSEKVQVFVDLRSKQLLIDSPSIYIQKR